MKSREEMWIEARRLQEVGRQSVENRRIGGGVETSLAASAAPLVLFSFPESSVRINWASEHPGPFTHRMVRTVQFSENDPEGEYKLVEEETVISAEGEVFRHYDPIDLVSSDDPFEIVSAGYQRLDEDRFRERLEPVIDRLESTTFPEPVTKDDLAEMEKFVSELELSPAAKLRVKVDSLAFLEGRLEAGDFIARTVARQKCYQTVEALSVGQRITESIEVS